MRWSSFVFLDPISLSNRRFHLHLATFHYPRTARENVGGWRKGSRVAAVRSRGPKQVGSLHASALN